MIFPLGDGAVIVELGDQMNEKVSEQAIKLAQKLEQQPFPGFIEAVPAYTTVTVFYRPEVFDQAFAQVSNYIQKAMKQLSEQHPIQGRTIKIPVCYGGAFGPDLDEVAHYHGLPPEEVIERHTNHTYTVAFLGFSPGFPFLLGLDPAIATPRKSTPRTRVPAGSVGIAGQQTGIYPVESPGGWQIIGRTPLSLFFPEKEQPTLIRPGDRIIFQPISEKEFHVIVNGFKEDDE